MDPALLISEALNAISALAQKQMAETNFVAAHGTEDEKQSYIKQILDMQQPIADLAKGISDLAQHLKDQIAQQHAAK